MPAHLEIWLDGGKQVVALAGAQVTIGRSSANDIALDDPAASRRHALLERLAAGWWIHDLNSLNGTLVNGVPVQREAPLYSGDEIMVGSTKLVYWSEATP